MNAPLKPIRLPMREIIELAEQYFGVSANDILSPRKEARIVEARSIAMYACRELLPVSYPQIGRAFGGRDHTTAMHACKQVTQEILLDPDFSARVEAFLVVCRGATPLSPPDTDPFETARRVMMRPALATNVSINTIRDFAAIISAAIVEAEARDDEAEKIEAIREAFGLIEPEVLAFVTSFRALDSASPTGEAKARRTFDKHAAALVAALETAFNLKRTFK